MLPHTAKETCLQLPQVQLDHDSNNSISISGLNQDEDLNQIQIQHPFSFPSNNVNANANAGIESIPSLEEEEEEMLPPPIKKQKVDLFKVFQQQAQSRNPPRLVSFKRKKSSSKYKGVLFVKSQCKWRAQVCLGGKKKYIGSYDSELEAALARDKKILQLFGDRPELLNFPQQPPMFYQYQNHVMQMNNNVRHAHHHQSTSTSMSSVSVDSQHSHGGNGIGQDGTGSSFSLDHHDIDESDIDDNDIVPIQFSAHQDQSSRSFSGDEGNGTDLAQIKWFEQFQHPYAFSGSNYNQVQEHHVVHHNHMQEPVALGREPYERYPSEE